MPLLFLLPSSQVIEHTMSMTTGLGTKCRLRALVHDALAKHLTDSAAFFADKLATLSGGAPADVYLLCQVGFFRCPDLGCAAQLLSGARA